MEQELKHLIDEKWEWKVKKVAEKEFLAIFPNKQILDAFSKSAGFKMVLYNTWASVTPSTRDPDASSILQTGWVRLDNVPDRARTVEAITLIGELAGKVVVVDELSVIKEGSVRVKLKARDIEKLRGYIEIFVDGVGYEIKFTPEMAKEKAYPKFDPPGPPSHQDDADGDDEADDLLDSEEERPKRGGKYGAQSSNVEQEKKGSGSRGRQVALMGDFSESGKGVADPRPLAMYDPVTAQFVEIENTQDSLTNAEQIQDGGQVKVDGTDNLTTAEFSHGKAKGETHSQGISMKADSRLTDKVGEDGSPDYFLVHCENEGTRLIHKDRWPVLKLPSEGRKEGTVNEEMKDLGNSQDSLGPGEIEEGGLFTLITQNIETEEEALEDYKSGSDTWVGSFSTIPR
ncbi:unnamed protein product [Urochloa humidicola]